MTQEQSFSVKIKNDRYYVSDEVTGMLAEGDSFDDAFQNLKTKQEQEKRLYEQAGLNGPFNALNGSSLKPKTSYVKKWLIAFAFVSLMSIPLSYSLSLGIKNGLTGIKYPYGGEVWERLGDMIIRAADSKTLNETERQEEILNAIQKIRAGLDPYLKAISGSEMKRPEGLNE